jgi:hypothetical protein
MTTEDMRADHTCRAALRRIVELEKLVEEQAATIDRLNRELHVAHTRAEINAQVARSSFVRTIFAGR